MSAPTRTIRTVIVDDEPVARDLIRIRLEREPDLEIVGEAADGASAIETVAKELPDLLFLDIQLPGMTGFQVLDALSTRHLPHVVFVTAFDRFALRAFEAHAVDYLMKPVSRERWLHALARARAMVHAGSEAQHARVADMLASVHSQETESTGAHHGASADASCRTWIRRFVVRDGERIFLVPAATVDWIEASGNYALVHVGARTHRIRMTMASLERELDPDVFVRIHRKTIVNLDRIAEIVPSFHGDFDVTLRDGSRLRLSRAFRANVLR